MSAVGPNTSLVDQNYSLRDTTLWRLQLAKLHRRPVLRFQVELECLELVRLRTKRKLAMPRTVNYSSFGMFYSYYLF